MIINFSFNELEQFALNETRYYDFYWVAREICVIIEGEFFGPNDLRVFLDNSSQSVDGYGDVVVEVLDKTYSRSLLMHAIDTHDAMNEMRASLNIIHGFGMLPATVKEARANVKRVKMLLAATEW